MDKYQYQTLVPTLKMHTAFQWIEAMNQQQSWAEQSAMLCEKHDPKHAFWLYLFHQRVQGVEKRRHQTTRQLKVCLAQKLRKLQRRMHERRLDSGSYVVWGAKASSPEAITAIKRLKAKQSSSKGDKRPVLVVAYPAQVSECIICCVVSQLRKHAQARLNPLPFV